MADTSRPSLVLVPKHRSAAPEREAERDKRERKRARRNTQQIIPANLFRDALSRERRRADRFEESFVLLLISLSARTEQPARWAPVVDALSTAKHDTDVIGWFEQDRVLGLIRPLAAGNLAKAATDLAPTVQRELERWLTQDNSPGCSLRLEVYSPGHESLSALLDATTAAQRLRARLRDGAKRALDVLGSAALLIFLSPVFLVVSGVVRLTSKGPIFFRQTRIGHRGNPFTMLKFRTMRVDADDAIHQQYVADYIQSTAAASSEAPVFKIVNDPRITKVGHFLRRSSLDELPQFWNVLRGDMSLVGPRPPLPYEVARYKAWHRRRLLEAKPGITGLWQVTGRSRTTFDDMVRLDLRYAKNYSVWKDLRILLATPRAVVSGKGAH
jgi:lipopolysaccharide/colanic/teichoic acid biosynthesis glycosyltransferase